ncbi:translation elongation factor Ts [bacterium]|nr:translation elongation factor Ts [bacterium]
MDISAQLVKDLRAKTGAGFMECKKALAETGGDIEKSVEYLRKKGIATAAKKAGRETSQGLIHSYIHGNGRIGVLLEINCETDFVARTNEFKELSKDMAMQIAAYSPLYVAREDVPAELIEKEKEIYFSQVDDGKKPQQIIDKIVTGKLDKNFFSRICLMEQPFIREDKKTVRDIITEKIASLGENINIKRFVRFELGEDV